ncbi:MAG: hypothetical protein ABI606_01730 [Rhodoferax sp.]
MKSVNQKQLDRAVELAAAFVANGDIRLAGSTRENSTAMAMLGDLITTLYVKLGNLEQELPGD